VRSWKLLDAFEFVDESFLDLVESEAIAAKRKKNIFRYVASVAACLVLVILASVVFRPGNVAVSIYGQPLGEHPVIVQSPMAAMSMEAAETRNADMATQVNVEFELKADKKLTLRAQAGTLKVLSPESGEVIYEGDEYKLKSVVKVIWALEDMKQDETYKLIFSNSDEILLEFDNDINNWIINRK